MALVGTAIQLVPELSRGTADSQTGHFTYALMGTALSLGGMLAATGGTYSENLIWRKGE